MLGLLRKGRSKWHFEEMGGAAPLRSGAIPLNQLPSPQNTCTALLSSGLCPALLCDQVLIDPPWPEYVRRAPHMADEESWTWQEIMSLPIESITDTPSFVFLW